LQVFGAKAGSEPPPVVDVDKSASEIGCIGFRGARQRFRLTARGRSLLAVVRVRQW
jgi:hypothetical protein